ncbi:MAG: ABC transporter substrate-binding protein [Dehalococcoidales bacterium]|nr:ABC transporter substrate-binding protein [Dehalococcoidales bacterium]
MEESKQTVTHSWQSDHPVTRRDVLKAMGLGGVGILLAACAQPQPGPTTAPPATAPATSAPPSAPAPTKAPAAAPTAAAKPAGGKLVFATKVDTPNLEPFQEISDARMRRSCLTYDALVDWKDDLTIGPGLAESWEATGTKWVFHLRKGAYFSNGKEADGDDVIYSIKLAQNSAGKGFYSAISDIKATDKYTVEMTLSKPSSALLAALGGRYSYIIPKDGDKQNDLKQTAVGTGPYTVKEFVQNQRLVLQKNPKSWHAPNVQLDELTIRIIPDEANIVAGLRTGEVNVALFEDSKNYLLFKDDPNLVAGRAKALRWDVLDFPVSVAPFDNVKLRQAISVALDRESIMAAAIGGLGTLVGGYPAALWGAMSNEQNPFFKRDVAKAKQLLQEGGITTPLKLTLRSIVGYSALNAAAQVIVENLKEIGITAEIAPVDLGIWIDDFSNRKMPTFTMNSWAGFLDPDMLFYNHLHKQPEGQDFRRWNNAEISALLDKGRTTLDRAEREKVYLQVQQLVAEQCPWIPLYSADIITAQTKAVKNFNQHPTGYYHGLRYVGMG